MLYPDITKIQPKHNIMWTFGVCWEFTFSFGGNSQSIVYFYCTVLFLTKQMGCDFPPPEVVNIYTDSHLLIFFHTNCRDIR